MSKYNILLVRKASFSDDIIPELRLDDTIEASFSHKLDSLIETDMIENELKVLINYRDNFNNASFSENLIDDIFINFKGNEISYGFFNIGQTETEDKVFDVINDEVEAIDIDSLLRIRNLINDNKIKFNIFETLRSNENTNLYNLLKSRINEFDKEFNNDPKIEFTITPLSIYCNHIVKKSCVFNIKSKNELYKDYVVEYNIEYNPLNIKEIDYPIYGDGDIDKLKDDEELLIAYDDCCNNNELHPKITSKRFASNLYKINKYYDKDIYKYVYFLNESLVKLIDNELLPFDGNLDENTFLKSQIVRGEISGKYIYIDDAVEIDDKDILGVDLLDINKKRYISQELKRLCEVCGHMYGATDDVWNNYKNAHVLINDINRRSCCDNCKGTILNTGYAVIYSEGYKEYYLDDPKDIRYTAICPNCENKEDAFIHIGNIGNKHLGCKICKMHYCPKHMDLETNICINCNQKTLKRDIINDKSLLRNIKNALEPIDALNKELEFNINEDCNSIWVYAKRKNKTISYYFVTDENMKFVHLMAKYAKRGEE